MPASRSSQWRKRHALGYVQQDAGPYAEKVRALYARGMAQEEMARQAGVSERTIRNLISGRYSTGGEWRPLNRIQPYTAMAIKRLRYVKPAPRHGSLTDPTGTRRRAQALLVAGFPLRWQEERILGLEYGSDRLVAILKAGHLFSSTASRFAEGYAKYVDSDPESLGVSRVSVFRVRRQAARKGYAPASCWDEDTIDDPDAVPEWTGRCGTVYGWHIHRLQGIPLCDPCSAAASTASVVLVPELLVSARVKRGMTRPQAARASGIRVDTLRSWEIGRTPPRWFSNMDPLLAVLDVTLEEVTELKEK